MILLKLLMLTCTIWGAWTSFKALGTPVTFKARRYYREADSRYRRWYGGRAYHPDEIGP